MLENITSLAVLDFSFLTDRAFLVERPDLPLLQDELWLLVKVEVAGLRFSTEPIRMKAETLTEKLMLRHFKLAFDEWTALFVANLRLKHRSEIRIADPRGVTRSDWTRFGIAGNTQTRLRSLAEQLWPSMNDRARKKWFSLMTVRASAERAFRLATSFDTRETYWLCGMEVFITEPTYTADDARLEIVSNSRVGALGVTTRADTKIQRRQVVPERIRAEVWRRDQGRCTRCNSSARLEFDHIIPYSKGGSDTARNLQLLCERCNRVKGANGF